MHVHVTLMPSEFAHLALADRTALVVDVLRASSTVVAAFAAGCAAVIPVATPAEARERAATMGPPAPMLVGEQDGLAIPGFDLGNSPLECTKARVGGRTLVLTTTNGTAAMLKAREAADACVGALSNVSAAAAWARRQGRDVTVLCAGEKGRFCLEDAVCAGLIAERLLRGSGEAKLSDAARAAWALGRLYGPRLDRLRRDSAWARTLAARGRGADLDACLALDSAAMVPILEQGALVPNPGAALTCLEAAADTRAGRLARPDANR